MRTDIMCKSHKTVQVIGSDNGDIILSTFPPDGRVVMTPQEALALAKALRVYGELYELEH